MSYWLRNLIEALSLYREYRGNIIQFNFYNHSVQEPKDDTGENIISSKSSEEKYHV